MPKAKDGMSEEEIGFLEFAARSTRIDEVLVNTKRTVGSFGIQDADGEDITCRWVESSLAKKVKEPFVVKRDRWVDYQLASMFGKWNSDEQIIQMGSQREAIAVPGSLPNVS